MVGSTLESAFDLMKCVTFAVVVSHQLLACLILLVLISSCVPSGISMISACNHMRTEFQV
jgi:hypothetical protein